jgi:hypothetical protein
MMRIRLPRTVNVANNSLPPGGLSERIESFLLGEMANIAPDHKRFVEEQILGFVSCDPMLVPVL